MTSSNVILDEKTLQEAVKYFQGEKAMVFDFESMGDNRGVCHLNRLNWLSMATSGASIVVPFGHPIGTKQIGRHQEPRLCADGKTRKYWMPDWEAPPPQISPANVFEITRPLFFDEGITKVGHGVIFDIASGSKYWGEVPPGPWDDTIICDWLLNENRHQYKLKVRTKEMYGFAYDDEEVGRCIESHPFGKVAYYSYCDAKYPWLMYNHYLPQIQEQGLGDVHRLELDVLNVLVGMRLAGSHIDVPRLEELKDELTDAKIDAEKAVYVAAGREFNLNSAPQKQVILFGNKRDGGQKLKPWKPTDAGKKEKERGEKVTKWSTDDEVLESFPSNPVCMALREFGDVDKLLGTYVLGYLGDPAAKDKPCQIYDNRIYADFVQYGAKTGRFSCRKPNLQNIPRPDTERGKIIRGAWVAEKGWKLVVVDYSQIELVMFAHFAGKGALFEGFWNGIDPHTTTACSILNKTVDELVPDERQLYGKRTNFALGFGAGKYKVASMLGIEVDRAEWIMERHQKSMPEVYSLKNDFVRFCKKNGYVETLLGRRRRIPEIYSNDWGIRGYAERQAGNAPIQGSAADLQKLAMVRADTMLGQSGSDAFLSLTVHDELVVETPENDSDEVASIVKEAMIGPGIQELIRVPLSVDVKVVDRWSEAK